MVANKIQAVQFPSILSSISTKKDGSFKLIIETPELSGKEAAELFEYRQREGYTTFTPNAVAHVEVPEYDAEAGQKSKSQRLRAVIYRLWEARGRKGTFDEFYNGYLEQVIELTKEKID